MTQKSKTVVYRKQGTLVLIAGLLIGSAFVRAGIGAAPAFAKAIEPHEAPKAAHDDAMCKTDEDYDAMLEAFKSREASLVRQETEMKNRRAALMDADREIEEKLEKLRAAEEALRSTLALADTAAEDDISRLVTVYEGMKRKDAASLFEQMDPDFAAGFIGRMRPESAAQLMAGLSPEIAYSISIVLAGRNASVPKE